MMMLMSFGVPSSLPWDFSSGLVEGMLITLAIATLGIASAALHGLRHRQATLGRGRKSGRNLVPVRHPMPA